MPGGRGGRGGPGGLGGQVSWRSTSYLLAILFTVVTAITVGPTVAAAQTLGAPTAPGGAELPRWLMRWNPIRLTADLPRELPGAATSFPSLLTLPAPRVGTFWTAANPAGLPTDVYDEYAQFRLGVRQNDGSYRRPLDGGKDRLERPGGQRRRDRAHSGGSFGSGRRGAC